MALLTTSQLTFYDLKDAYHVEINPDCIIINCDEKGISKEETVVDISYGIYCGSTRIPGTAKVINFEINGSQISWTSTECNSIDDGHVEFTIPANINLSDIDFVNIQFVEKNNGDTEEFTFDKYIQLIKVTDGASGTGMVFKIYSEDGTAFREDMSEILLETFVFVGDSEVTPTSYKWQWRENATSDWTDIPNGTSDVLTVLKTDPWAFKTIRCQIEYNNLPYEDYISLTDDVVIYSSEIRYFNGSNVFNVDDKYLVAYMAVYKNGKEIDLLPANKYAPNLVQSIDDSGLITTDVKKEDDTEYGQDDADTLMYFITKVENKANVYTVVLGKFNGTNWHTVDLSDFFESYECVYLHSMSYDNLARDLGYNELNKIMVVSKEQVNKTLSISFNAYKKLDIISPVSVATGNVIDTHDPIISSEEPQNPANGQLWVDTSRVPYVIKVCKYKLQDDNTAIEWVNSNYQVGGAVYTSRPYSYLVGDIWILNDNESCVYTGADGLQYSYGPGSMLKSSASRTEEEIANMEEYPFSDWSDVDPKLTEMKGNIAQYFEFNSETGLKIGQKDQKFYVNISATEMGFYDNSNANDPNKKVVSIGNQSATIKNATLNEGAEFNCTAEFNNQLNIYNPYSSARKGFAWKIENDGSLSLVCADAVQKPIRGTWEDVFAAEEDGTYKQKYKIGDTLALDLGSEGVIDMQIAAFDADRLIDGNGNELDNFAKITWVAKQLLSTTHMMAPALITNSDGTYQEGTGAIRGWYYSNMRSYLSDDIFPKIPELIRNNIKSVRKDYINFTKNGTRSENYCWPTKLWIPSIRELNRSNNAETNGQVYSELFTDNASRIKCNVNTTTPLDYWTRTAYDKSKYWLVSSLGEIRYLNESKVKYGVALGFCT